jgi:hypothetical protein
LIVADEQIIREKPVHPFEVLDEDTPFGWIPPTEDD